jgi:cellulose synthase A
MISFFFLQLSDWLYSRAENMRGVDAGLGNVAWKERVDGWKMKSEKSVAPTMSTGQAASERGTGDLDARSDVLIDESLL